MHSTIEAKSLTVKLPIQVKPFLHNRRLCLTLPSDLARYLDVHEDNAIFEATVIEGGVAFYIKRKEAFA